MFNAEYIFGPKQNYFCLICLEEVSSIIQLECNCYCCEECLCRWAISFLEMNLFRDTSIIPCPMNCCSKSFEVNYILFLLNYQNRSLLNEKLLEKYCSQTKDILKCPNLKCNNEGILSIKPCEMPYQCRKCSFKWRENGLIQYRQSLNYYFFLFLYFKNEYFRLMSKLLIGNNCPKCSFYITNRNFFFETVCPSCKYEFCFRCLGSIKRNFGHTGIELCGLQPVYWIIFNTMMIYLIYMNFSEIFSFYSILFDQFILKCVKRMAFLIILLLFCIPFIATIDVYLGKLSSKTIFAYKFLFFLSLMISTSLIIFTIFLYYYLGLLLELIFTVAYLCLFWNLFFSSFALIASMFDLLKGKNQLAKKEFIYMIIYWCATSIAIFGILKVS